MFNLLTRIIGDHLISIITAGEHVLKHAASSEPGKAKGYVDDLFCYFFYSLDFFPFEDTHIREWKRIEKAPSVRVIGGGTGVWLALGRGLNWMRSCIDGGVV